LPSIRLRSAVADGDVQGYELTVLLAGGALAVLDAGPLSLDALLR
jgi:hypothetical protein